MVKFVPYMTPIPPEELDEKGPGHPNWDPDLECAKLRVISIKKQEEEQIAEKKRNNEYTDEPVIEPQKRALKLIPKQDLLLPSRWFDNDEDAEAFVIAACKGNNAAVDALGRTRTSNALLQFLRTVYGLRGQRKENKEDASPRLSLQELRDRHWQAVVEESSFARDFSPHLARHVTLMLLGANRPFKEHEKFLDGSTDLLTIIDKLLQWFEQNDAAELDEFDALHPEPKQLYAKRNAKTTRNGRKPGKWAGKGKHRTRRSLRASLARVPAKRFETRPPIPLPRPDHDIDLSFRPTNGRRGGQRRWTARRV